MTPVIITGHVDDKHRLSADEPESIPPGPLTVVVIPLVKEDKDGTAWWDGIAREWADELSDYRQDIYTLSDGEPLRYVD